MVFSFHLDEKLLKEPDGQQQQIPNPLMRPVLIGRIISTRWIRVQLLSLKFLMQYCILQCNKSKDLKKLWAVAGAFARKEGGRACYLPQH